MKRLDERQQALYEQQRARDLVSRSLAGIFMYLVVWSIIACLIYTKDTSRETLSWLLIISAIISAVSAFRLTARHLCLKNLDNPFLTETIQLIGIVLSSLTWGVIAGSAQLDTPLNLEHEIILLSTIGLSAGGAIGFSPSRVYTIVFLCCMLLPIAFSELFLGSADDLGTVIAAFVFLIGMSLITIQPNREYKAALSSNLILEDISNTDGLTQVRNRRSFDQRLTAEFRRAKRNATPLSLLMLDIDHFKEINDENGHVVGDHCLRIIADRMLKSIHSADDFLARFGGEEFAVILPNTTVEESEKIGVRLLNVISAEPIKTDQLELIITISVGSFTFNNTDQCVSEKEMVSRADQALYAAKHLGRNQVQIFNKPP